MTDETNAQSGMSPSAQATWSLYPRQVFRLPLLSRLQPQSQCVGSSAKMNVTPDGRHAVDRLAQGFVPSEYRCLSGITSVFNAIGSLDHSRLWAPNVNLSFEKTSMNAGLFAAVFRVTGSNEGDWCFF